MKAFRFGFFIDDVEHKRDSEKAARVRLIRLPDTQLADRLL